MEELKVGSGDFVVVHRRRIILYYLHIQLTETVASQFERHDGPPFFKVLNKASSSRDSVCESTGTKTDSPTPPLTSKNVDGKTKTLDEIGKKESKEERKEKVESLPRMSSVEQGSNLAISSIHQKP